MSEQQELIDKRPGPPLKMKELATKLNAPTEVVFNGMGFQTAGAVKPTPLGKDGSISHPDGHAAERAV